MLATFFSHSLKPPLNSVKVRTSSITRPRTFKHTTCASRLLSFLPKYLSFIHKMTTFSSAAASASSTTFLSDNAIPITVGINGKDYDQLIDSVGDARVVLIGEASHGTHDFYLERAYITQRLIKEKGFTAVCAEADFPDAVLINWYIQSMAPNDIKSAEDAVKEFKRFPLWMWRNPVVLEFIEWAKKWNDNLEAQGKSKYEQVSFHGLDVYSLHSSSEAVIQYLQDKDPEAAEVAKSRYGCFTRFGDDTMSYAFSVRYGLAKTCEKEVVSVLRDLLRKRNDYLMKQFDAFPGPKEEPQFVAEVNALVVKDAEKYYRSMIAEDEVSWNIRDTHFLSTLERVVSYLSKMKNSPAKVVVWAHNSHIGDARRTDMGQRRGEINIGQLCRERFGSDAFNIGFTTHGGTVTAAHKWDTPPHKFNINPARSDSFEHLFHQALNGSNFMLLFNQVKRDDNGQVRKDRRSGMDEVIQRLDRMKLLERYIGVIYKPDTERWSHYSKAEIGSQYDAIIHIDQTRHLKPLDKFAHFPDEDENVPELFPFGE
ncbi:hypothetical protein BKA69DRAFT_1061936 [Paraphysoderma sedebokerense]|nr:hypothetical protein BKA69DRAFT_1061936 [Paraphysoderma sedebokerense]